MDHVQLTKACEKINFQRFPGGMILRIFNPSVLSLFASNKYAVCFPVNSRWHRHARFPSIKVSCTKKQWEKQTEDDMGSNLLMLTHCWHIYVRCSHVHSLYTVEGSECVNLNNVRSLTHLHCWHVPRSAKSSGRTHCCKAQCSVWDQNNLRPSNSFHLLSRCSFNDSMINVQKDTALLPPGTNKYSNASCDHLCSDCSGPSDKIYTI